MLAIAMCNCCFQLCLYAMFCLAWVYFYNKHYIVISVFTVLILQRCQVYKYMHNCLKKKMMSLGPGCFV